MILLAASSPALAFQPVEAGLTPLHERLDEIRLQVLRLDQQLQAEASEPVERAQAYRTMQALELERRRLLADIGQTRRMAASPLVMHLATTP